MKNLFFETLTLRVAPGPLQDLFWDGFRVPVALILGVKHVDLWIDLFCFQGCKCNFWGAPCVGGV